MLSPISQIKYDVTYVGLRNFESMWSYLKTNLELLGNDTRAPYNLQFLTMKSVAALVALASSAAAFAPAQQSRSSTALADKPFADALGVQPPVSTLVTVADGNLSSTMIVSNCSMFGCVLVHYSSDFGILLESSLMETKKSSTSSARSRSSMDVLPCLPSPDT